MAAFLPCCAWCGQAVAVTPVEVVNGPTTYRVHPGQCAQNTEEYVASDVEEDEETMFVLQDLVTGRFDPEHRTWEESNAIAGPLHVIRRVDEVLIETGRA